MSAFSLVSIIFLFIVLIRLLEYVCKTEPVLQPIHAGRPACFLSFMMRGRKWHFYI